MDDLRTSPERLISEYSGMKREFADRFEKHRAVLGFDDDSVVVAALWEDVPAPDCITDDRLEALLNGDDYRQILHVTFGSVSWSSQHDFRRRICDILDANEEEYYAFLEEHFRRHVGCLMC